VFYNTKTRQTLVCIFCLAPAPFPFPFNFPLRGGGVGGGAVKNGKETARECCDRGERRRLVRASERAEGAPRRITANVERTIQFKSTTRSARASVVKILRILFIQCSNFAQKTPPIFTFARNGRSERVAKRHGMPFLRYAPRFLESYGKRAVAQAWVRLSKAQSKTKVLQPIFLFALSSDV